MSRSARAAELTFLLSAASMAAKASSALTAHTLMHSASTEVTRAAQCLLLHTAASRVNAARGSLLLFTQRSLGVVRRFAIHTAVAAERPLTYTSTSAACAMQPNATSLPLS